MENYFNNIINKAEHEELSFEDIKFLLSLEDKTLVEKLFKKAYEYKLKYVGNKVFFRGIIEFSNICKKDCYYCGIRKSNSNVERFIMDENDILNSAIWAHKQEFGSIVLQSGERCDENYVELVERVLLKIKEATNNELGVTLSLGEQSKETYQRWYKAGAHRYLLRIETSNKSIYNKIHPENHLFEERLQCLYDLKELGYQVGTGVMIGLPFQTTEDLVNDILFFKKMDVAMIGMGPYIVHKETPLAQYFENFDEMKEYQLNLGLKMIAVTRLFLKDVNIASTTALQTLDPVGREKGLLAGANIIMPNISDVRYRKNYQLYDNKPCLDENANLCRMCLEGRILHIGEKIGFNEWGDSPHFKKNN